MATKEIKVGSKAPAFTAATDTGEKVKLSDFAGKKVILYFYPRDNTPGCTREARAFRDAAVELEKRNTAIVGGSTNSADSHARFAANNELPFPLLADTDAAVAKAYGVLKENGKTAERATFLIDAKGSIRHVWPKVSITGHTAEILAKIEELAI